MIQMPCFFKNTVTHAHGDARPACGSEAVAQGERDRHFVYISAARWKP